MFEMAISFLQKNALIVVLLAIALGNVIGKWKFKGFSFGSTVGVLFAGLVLGQLRIEVDPILKTIGFAIFIFAVGYGVGPQFFGALRKDGLGYIWVSLVVALTGLVTTILLAIFFKFDPGTAAGLLSGAMTQSTVIGTADGAINALPISSAQQTVMQGNVAIAYAITYVFGVAGLILFFKIFPKMVGVDVVKGSKEIEAKMSGGGEENAKPWIFSWYKRLDLRAYQVSFADKKVSDVEKMLPGHVTVESVKRADQIIDPQADLVVQQGDEIAVAGRYSSFVDAEKLLGKEVDDSSVLNVSGEIASICVTSRRVFGHTLAEIGDRFGHGIYLKSLSRGGHSMPLTRDTLVNRCDILKVSGSERNIENFIKQAGFAERATSATDLTMLGIACVIGALIGMITVPIAGIPVTLGLGGGVLLAGLVCGWLRAVHPTFGQVSGGALWIFSNLGLNLFVACVGLSAGPTALDALKHNGGAIFLAGMV
ncbi:MAG: hypothetical protein KKH83_05160, partial [Candidatus Margulisbacteria bacterium]|nr:hypothetical protein [Candidatus Margulisiibacteriota bacterium]